MTIPTMTLSTPDLMELYRRLLPQSDLLPLQITGSSMTPFLAGGRDMVYLSAVSRPLRRGDIVLYQRDGGSYVLHRICAVESGGFTLIGDAHTHREPGIRPDQIFGLVQKVRRKGRTIGPDSFWWIFFEKIWVRIIPLRPLVLRVWRGCRGLVSED